MINLMKLAMLYIGVPIGMFSKHPAYNLDLVMESNSPICVYFNWYTLEMNRLISTQAHDYSHKTNDNLHICCAQWNVFKTSSI